MNNLNILRTTLSVEHLRWLFLCLLEGEEEESMEQGSKEKIFQMKAENFI